MATEMKYFRRIFFFALIAGLLTCILSDRPSTGQQADIKSVHQQRTASHTHRHTTPAISSAFRAPKEIITEEVDHIAQLREAKKLEKNKRVYRFAKAIAVNLTPNNAGEWQRLGDFDVWKLCISSPGASSLNLGFKNYRMPEGGELTIHRPRLKSPYRAFTHADNEEHGELWTPLLSGEKIIVCVSLPAGKRDQLALQISSINHGFRPVFSRNMFKSGSRKIGGEISGICNIDAVCRSGDPNINETLGPILDIYQDQIRSVAAYTLGGVDTCSGALINNTSNNKKPFFLTARHCFENPDSGAFVGNPSSAVFYFNFQNSYCRPRSSAESAGVGDGDLSEFMSGSVVRAHHASSDFCLLEIDDPIPASYDVFYSGWNRTNIASTMAVGIHHPAVAEKRISVDTDSLSHNGDFWMVVDWDFGTTEGGSSGSPLFDSDGRIVGQLLGGYAACGNDLEDEYGKVFKSWTGNGSNSTRLSNWLDPTATGVSTHNGIAHSPALNIENAVLTEGDSGVANMTFTVKLSNPSGSSVTVDFQTSNDSAVSGSDFTSTTGTLTFGIGETEKTINVPISGDTTAENNETFFLNLTNPTGAIIRTSQATGTILTDDFSTPVLSGPTSVNGSRNALFSYQLTVANLPATFSLTGSYPPGMSIDPETGRVEWIPTATGSFSYTVRASNPAGIDTKTVNVNVTSGASTLSAAELEQRGVAFQTEGTSWARQTSITHDGTDALKSGNISHNQASSFSITANGPGTISFWLRVSSETNYDFCYFALNGDTLLVKSGNTGWVQHSYDLAAGPNTLAWMYIKDFSDNGGSDAVWLDEIVFGGYAGWTATYGIVSAGQFTKDAEGDGAANGIEYATGLSPLSYDAHLLPAAQLDTDQLLRLTFTKPTGVSGILYDAEVSDDLLGWSTAERVILTNSSGSFDAKQTLATPAASKKFMRLKITPAP